MKIKPDEWKSRNELLAEITKLRKLIEQNEENLGLSSPVVSNCDSCGAELKKGESRRTGGKPESFDGTQEYFTSVQGFDFVKYLCSECWTKVSKDMYGYRENPEDRQKSGWYRDKDGIWVKYDGSHKHTCYAKKPDYMTSDEWARMHLAQINQLMDRFLSK